MASTAASPSEIQGQLAQVYAEQINNQYISVAMAAWFVWDHITTLDKEVKLIWSSRQFTPISVLFVVIRYGISISYPLSLYATFARSDSSDVCPYSDAFLVLFTILGHCIQLALGLRVWALYQRSRAIGVFLVLLFLALVAISFDLIVSYFMQGRSAIPPVVPESVQLFGCLMNPIPGYFRSIVATTAFETMIVAMTIWKVFRTIRKQPNLPLVNYFLTSGLIYYVAMLAMLILNLLTDRFPVLQIPILSSSCILVVQGVACCHIILGMLHQGAKRTHSSTGPTQDLGEETQQARPLFNIPTGLYSKEALEDWEYGLPPLDMTPLADDDDEGTEFPLGPVSASTIPSNV